MQFRQTTSASVINCQGPQTAFLKNLVQGQHLLAFAKENIVAFSFGKKKSSLTFYLHCGHTPSQKTNEIIIGMSSQLYLGLEFHLLSARPK